MTTARLLPPVPRPPDDPTWLALDATQGWHAASLDAVTITALDSVLQLAVASGGRVLTEASGSLGGTAPPTNVAVADDGSVYLLDLSSARLKRFDPCSCTFLTVPAVGGTGAGARQFADPHGLALVQGNLFVADTGNARVSVFSANEYILRGALTPPATANLAQPWTPVAVAGDCHGRIFVADPANGCVHRFGRSGVWQTAFMGLGAVRHLAVDCGDRLYVVIDGAADVRVLNGHGVTLEGVSSVGSIAHRFGALPCSVDKNGALDFGPPCGAFDPTGAPLPNGVAVDTIKYEKTGTYLSEPLDSRIYRCQWHRIMLCGEIPAGASILVSTYTAEVDLPLDVVLALPNDAWQTNQVARSVRGEWDCLIRSGGGRYLWLRLDLNGGATATPCLGRVRIEFPRITLRRYLPAVFGEDPIGADFTDRFLGIFDTTLRSIESELDTQASLFDPRSAPATPDPTTGVDFLSWLASWVGITLDRQWPEAKQRAFLRLAPKLYDIRGTRDGLWKLLLLYLGIDGPSGGARCHTGNKTGSPAIGPRSTLPPRCRPRPLNCAPPPPARPWQPPPIILEHFTLRRWLFVGSGRLGDQAVLWGRSIVNRSRLDDGAQADRSQLITTQDPYRDPFHVYASRFTVFIPACIGASVQQRKSLERLLATESPAHTQYHVEYVAPRFRIGVQSMIGLDAVVGCYPSGVTVGTSSLGRSSVLGESPDGLAGGGQPHPSMRIGSRSQIGSTTRLD